MSSVSCRKLIIDRQRAPKSVPTFNISQFGNYKFPSSGEYSGGIVAQSLAGIGKSSSKKNSRVRVAGHTGATTATENLPTEEPVSELGETTTSTSESYTVQFIQHVPEPVTEPALEECSYNDYARYERQESGLHLRRLQVLGQCLLQNKKKLW